MDVVGKVVVITGGASGLGYAAAAKLSTIGAKVVILDQNESTIKQAQHALGVEGFAVDVRRSDHIQSVVDQLIAEYGAIAACVNCAGIVRAARVVGRDEILSIEAFDEVIQVNLIGSFNVTRLVAAAMIAADPDDNNERGIIINTASVAAYEGQVGQVAYSASKGGIVAMTLPLAREFAQFGVRVMSIAPGIMETPMMSGMTENVQQRLHASVPFPKRMGLPEEFADLVLHIINNQYLNGSVIRLDGAIRLEP